MEKGEISKIRERPGESNAGKYKNVANKNFAGPDKTFPINSLARGRNALARAHFAKNPEGIKEKVYQKYLKRNGYYDKRKNPSQIITGSVLLAKKEDEKYPDENQKSGKYSQTNQQVQAGKFFAVYFFIVIFDNDEYRKGLYQVDFRA